MPLETGPGSEHQVWPPPRKPRRVRTPAAGHGAARKTSFAAFACCATALEDVGPDDADIDQGECDDPLAVEDAGVLELDMFAQALEGYDDGIAADDSEGILPPDPPSAPSGRLISEDNLST